ncbi:AAA family ATPase [Streptomyces sp. NPDC006463]|uniref:ATP-binding protein n=1 Tax=Streptomyces sp. NPDC006463 TaxID=3364746 RepID=UPI00369B30B4
MQGEAGISSPSASRNTSRPHATRLPAVGGVGEIGELLPALEAAEAGHPGLALVEGAMGMGRTTLLDRLARHGQARAMTVLRAQCGSREQAFNFGVVRQLFRSLPSTGHIDKPPSADWLFGVFEGLHHEVTRIAERAPLLMVVDDFHYSDPQSAQWIDFLARRLRDAPILVVLSTNPDIPSAQQELTAELALHPQGHSTTLGPLSAADVAELTGTVLEHDPDDDFVQYCLRLSGGNPKLLTLLLREFTRSGVTPTTGDLSRAADAAAAVMASVLPTWLEPHSSELSAVAGMTAVLGEEADPRLTQRLTGMSDRAITSALAALGRIGLLHKTGSRRFFHPLVRAALASDLPVSERSDIHARAAQLLYTNSAPHHQVARHIVASESPCEQWQLEVLRAAADDASARGATDEAITYLRHAAHATPSVPERAALLVELGTLEASMGLPSSVQHLGEGIGLTEDHALQTRAIPLLAEELVQCGQARRAVDLLDMLTAETEPQDTETLHRLWGQRAVSAVAAGLPAQIPPHTTVPTELSGATPGERVLLAAHALQMSMGTGTADEAAGCAERALRAFDAGRETLWAATLAIGTLRHAGRLELAGQWAETIGGFGLKGQPLPIRAVLLAELSQIRLHLDDLPGALAAGEEGLRLLPGPHPYGAFVAAAAMAPLIENGQLDAARRIADDRRFRNSPENWLRPYFLAVRAQLRASEGQDQSALHDLEHCGRLLSQYGGDNPGRIDWRSRAALLHRKQGQDEEAQRLCDEELVLARRWGAPVTLAKSLRSAALAGPRAESLDLLEESVALLENTADRLELVKSLIAQGTALHRADRTEAAREKLRRALGLAQAGSARRAAEEAYQKLVATGARPRRFSQVGPRALTTGQRRVAELALMGLSNEEIARRLYVTQRTVEFHLTHTYRKLGINSRTDLVRTLGSSLAA